MNLNRDTNTYTHSIQQPENDQTNVDVDEDYIGDIELEDLDPQRDIVLNKDAIKLSSKTGVRNMKHETMAVNSATEYGESELMLDS